MLGIDLGRAETLNRLAGLGPRLLAKAEIFLNQPLPTEPKALRGHLKLKQAAAELAAWLAKPLPWESEGSV